MSPVSSVADRADALLLRSPLLDVPGVLHGFSTRRGGVTPGPMGPLNLARRPGETDAALAENWRRVVHALVAGLGAGDLALLEQVHGADVARVESGRGPLEVVARADAAVTTRPGVILTARTADCVPVLFAAQDARGRAVGIAVALAGRRGVVGDVVSATIAALRAACDAREVIAAIGPHIGPDVVAALACADLDPARFSRRDGERTLVDLRSAVAEQLSRAGVTRVAHVHGCTWTDPTFHSHRRDGERSGRLSGVIALRW
jgi:YfiH family protein